MKVALLQMVSHGLCQQRNLQKGERFCRRARAMGADIALFPEMWNVGYALGAAGERLAEYAVSTHGPFVGHFRALARELDMAIAITYLERHAGRPRNTVSLIDRRGAIGLTYAKVHTCDFDREAALEPGPAFAVCTLDTRAGEVAVGAMICYDREFPESARVLMLQGAEIVLTPNACPLDRNRLAQFQTRAFENMLSVAMTNYAAPQENGRSVAFDGIAFAADGAPRDMTLAQATGEEGVHIARFDLPSLRAYRARETWGDAFRKPGAYGPLTAGGVRAPFVRPSARR